MNALQVILLLGVPGLALGGTLGFAVASRRALAVLFLVGTIAFLVGITNPPEGSREDDDDPIVFAIFAMVTNFAGYGVGLGLGAVTRRTSVHREGRG